MTDGQLWSEQRRFTVRHLKDLGFGKTSLEGLMLQEVSDLMTDFQVSRSFVFHGPRSLR